MAKKQKLKNRGDGRYAVIVDGQSIEVVASV